MGLAALQSDRQVQLLAQVLDDAVDLIVCHIHPPAYRVPTNSFFSIQFLLHASRARLNLRLTPWQRDAARFVNCLITLSGCRGELRGPPIEAALHMTTNARAVPKTISVFTPAIMMPR
jgi:hypothetical protein